MQETSDDEISIRDLVNILRSQIKTIFAVAGVVVLLAAAYAFLAPRVYSTQAQFTPPRASDLMPLNLAGITPVTQEAAFHAFNQQLTSVDLRRRFFEEARLVDTLNPKAADDAEIVRTFLKFNENLRVENKSTAGKKKNSADSEVPRTLVTLEGKDPLFIAETVNRFSDLAMRTTVELLANEIKTAARMKLTEIEREMTALETTAHRQRLDTIARMEEEKTREVAEIKNRIEALMAREEQSRQDRIDQLGEALTLAKALGIEDPADYPIMSPGDKGASAATPIVTNITSGVQPLYYRGATALKTEIELLKERKSVEAFSPALRELQRELREALNDPAIDLLRKRETDKPFIDGLRKLEAQRERLENISFDVSAFRAAYVDQPAFVSSTPDKPKRMLVLALGLVFGAMLGVLAAFLRHALRDEANAPIRMGGSNDSGQAA